MGSKTERSRLSRAELDRSFEERGLVRIIRKPRAAGPVDGVVVARGIRWVVLERLSPDLDLDGYSALRWKHVKRVQSFESRSLAARATLVGEARSIPTEVFDMVTRVDFGGRYLTGLARAIGVS